MRLLKNALRFLGVFFRAAEAAMPAAVLAVPDAFVNIDRQAALVFFLPAWGTLRTSQTDVPGFTARDENAVVRETFHRSPLVFAKILPASPDNAVFIDFTPVIQNAHFYRPAFTVEPSCGMWDIRPAVLRPLA